MAVKIRLQRGGARHAPYYRVVVAESSSPRDGRFVEKVGTYDPKNKDNGKQIAIKLDRVDYWLGVGAQPTDTVKSLIRKARRGAPAEEAAPAETPAPAAAETPAAEAVPAEKPTPVVEEAVPAEKPTPVVEESAPVVEEVAPVVEEAAPAAVEEAPAEAAESAEDDTKPA
jgi:small subunit ribosomal protein S16